MRSAIRNAVDSYAPGLARTFRTWRDGRSSHSMYATPWGFRLLADAPQHENRGPETDLFQRLAADAGMVVDIGANVGLFTLLAAKAGASVVAVEPSQSNLPSLLQNLSLNDAAGVEVLPVALGEQAGVLPLYGAGQGASLLAGWGGIAATHSTLVPVHRLDDLLADRLAGKRLLVKVDAEGAELPILRGAPRLLEENAEWIVEIGLTENFAGKVNPDFVAIFELFAAAGYKAQAVEADMVVVSVDDAVTWARAGERPFYAINYLFSR